MLTEIFISTAALAICSAVGSVLFGAPLGWFVASLGIRSRALISALFAIPFLLPAFLVGIVLLPLVETTGTSWAWVVLAHVLMNAGFVGLITAASLSGIDQEQLQQAQIDGASPIQVARFVQLPQLRNPLISAALLVSLYSATSYGLVLSLGGNQVRTLETEIAQRVLYLMDFETGGQLAALQVLLSVSLIFASAKLGGAGLASLFGQASYRIRAGFIPKLFAGIYLAGILGFIFVLFQRSNFPSGFLLLGTKGARDVLNVTPLEAFGNSILNLLIALAICFPVAWWLANSKSNLLERLVILPLGISPVVIGLALLIFSGWLGQLGITLPFTAIAHSLIVLPLVYQLLRPAITSFSRELLDAGKLDGASKFQIGIHLKLPILKRPILVALVFGALASLGEFGAASFLSFGSQSTLSVVLFQLASRPGPQNLSMALSIALIYLMLALVVVLLITREQKESEQQVVVVR